MARVNEDCAGRWARLRRDIDTRGGSHFPKGSTVFIKYVDCGKLCIRMKNPDPMNIFGPKWLTCTNVSRWDVELLPDRAHPAPKPAAVTCDCGKVELKDRTEVRPEPYAKVVQVAGLPAYINHAVAGCFKMDYLHQPVLKVKSQR